MKRWKPARFDLLSPRVWRPSSQLEAALFPDDPFEPTLLGAARRFWWIVLACAVAGVGLAWLVHATVAGDWIARASLLVENPENARLFDDEAPVSEERYTADQVAIIQSTPTAARALVIAQERSGLEGLSIEDFTGAVEVESSIDNGLIELIVSNPDPDEALAVANGLIAAYQENREIEAADNLEVALDRLDSSLADIDAELADLQTEIAEADDPALAALLETRSHTMARRAELALSRDQLQVDAALASTGIALVSPAERAEQAIGLPRALVFGLLLGGVLGVILAFAYATRSNRFNHRNEPELLLNAPLLAEIPDFDSERLGTLLPTRDNASSATAEAFRFAVSAMATRPGAHSANRAPLRSVGAVGIVSGAPGDGASVITANVAVAAAEGGARVLAVDCDFGNPNLARILSVRGKSVGLTDVVIDSYPLEGSVVGVPVDGAGSLDLLSRGSHNVTAPHFFGSDQAASFFVSMRDRYDLVLVDVPPLLEAAYTATVLGLCDRVVFVVPHRSEVSRAVEAVERLYLAGLEISGYVYNSGPGRSRLHSATQRLAARPSPSLLIPPRSHD